MQQVTLHLKQGATRTAHFQTGAQAHRWNHQRNQLESSLQGLYPYDVRAEGIKNITCDTDHEHIENTSYFGIGQWDRHTDFCAQFQRCIFISAADRQWIAITVLLLNDWHPIAVANERDSQKHRDRGDQTLMGSLLNNDRPGQKFMDKCDRQPNQPTFRRHAVPWRFQGYLPRMACGLHVDERGRVHPLEEKECDG